MNGCGTIWIFFGGGVGRVQNVAVNCMGGTPRSLFPLITRAISGLTCVCGSQFLIFIIVREAVMLSPQVLQNTTVSQVYSEVYLTTTYLLGI